MKWDEMEMKWDEKRSKASKAIQSFIPADLGIEGKPKHERPRSGVDPIVQSHCGEASLLHPEKACRTSHRS